MVVCLACCTITSQQHQSNFILGWFNIVDFFYLINVNFLMIICMFNVKYLLCRISFAASWGSWSSKPSADCIPCPGKSSLAVVISIGSRTNVIIMEDTSLRLLLSIIRQLESRNTWSPNMTQCLQCHWLWLHKLLQKIFQVDHSQIKYGTKITENQNLELWL